MYESPLDESSLNESNEPELSGTGSHQSEYRGGESPLYGSPFPALSPLARRVAPAVAVVALAAAGFAYSVHERHAATNLAAQNQQLTAQLTATHQQLSALAERVNTMAAAAAKPSPAMPAAEAAPHGSPIAMRSHPVRHRDSLADQRFKKLQSQVDAQGKAIDAERADLDSTRTELGGSIARTHDELVTLEKRGQKNYFEFDLTKSKEYRREGPLSVRLKKANVKHQYADLMLIVDDRDLAQKHVNLYQPVTFYQPGLGQPVEVVINGISKNHIHGYVTAPKYRESELAAANGANAGAQPRQQLTLPATDPGQQ